MGKSGVRWVTCDTLHLASRGGAAVTTALTVLWCTWGTGVHTVEQQLCSTSPDSADSDFCQVTAESVLSFPTTSLRGEEGLLSLS